MADEARVQPLLHASRPRQIRRDHDLRDYPVAEIEARYQAALKEVKRSRRLSGDVRWDSSLNYIHSV